MPADGRFGFNSAVKGLKCVDGMKSKTVFNLQFLFCHPFGLCYAGRLHHSSLPSYATALCFSYALHRTCYKLGMLRA